MLTLARSSQLQLLHAGQMLQPRIGYAGAREHQHLHRVHAGQLCHAGVGQLGLVQGEPFELGESFQAGAGDLGRVEIEFLQAAQISQPP